MKKIISVSAVILTSMALAGAATAHASPNCDTRETAKNASIQFVEQNDLSDPASQNMEIKTVQARKDASDSGNKADAFFITVRVGAKSSRFASDSTVINVMVEPSSCKVLDLERSE